MANVLQSTNSDAANWNQINGLIREVSNDQKIRVIKDDTGTPVVVLDKNGLRTTKPGDGVDVTHALTSQYTFNSAQNTLKVVLKNTSTIFTNANTTEVTTIAHNLGFRPVAFVFLSTALGYEPMPTTVSTTRDDVNGRVYEGATYRAYTDATNLYIKAVNALSTRVPTTGTYGILYYLLQETAG